MRNKAIWIGGIIGLAWGIWSYFLAAALLEKEITLIKILFILPTYLAITLFGRSEFYLIIASSIIGLLIGALIGLAIQKIKKKNIIVAFAITGLLIGSLIALVISIFRLPPYTLIAFAITGLLIGSLIGLVIKKREK